MQGMCAAGKFKLTLHKKDSLPKIVQVWRGLHHVMQALRMTTGVSRVARVLAWGLQLFSVPSSAWLPCI